MKTLTLPSEKEYHFSAKTKSFIKAALEEDISAGDKTSDLLVPAIARGKAVIIAKEKGVFCGSPVLHEIFHSLDETSEIKFYVREGERFAKNQTVAEVEGSISAILKGERTALNFIAHLSGITARTREFVNRVKDHPVFILDTRKTTPLWRELEKYAVRVGGGRNHRMNLNQAIFVKENHRPFGNLKNLERSRGNFEIEVRNLKELQEALRYEPSIILFDNFTPAGLHKGVLMARKQRPEVILEASGGITLENVAHYAAMGVDWISVGSLTHSVKAVDFSLLVR